MVVGGVDVGATKTLIAVSRGARLLAVDAFPTPRLRARAALRLLGDRIEALRRRAGGARLAALGIGVPAVCDPARGRVVWAPNLPGWRNVPLGRILRARFRCPVALENDADMAALGEARWGAGRGCRDFVTLTVGTGIGGGLVVNGALARGAGDVAGAAGWMRLRGTRLEDVASGPAIARAAGRADARSSFLAAASGDARARRAVRRAGEALGSAVADLVSILNPAVVILGGGVMDGGARRLLPAVRDAVRRYAQPLAARRVRILASPLGNRAGVRGALEAARRVVAG